MFRNGRESRNVDSVVETRDWERVTRAGAGILVGVGVWLGLGSASLGAAVEMLGVAERRALVGGYAVSPGCAEYPARLLISFKGDLGNWIVNLHDGAARKVTAAGFAEDFFQWPSLVGADGKLFISGGRGGLSVYDPVTDEIRLVRPIPGARWLRGMAIGPDGAVYVSDYPTGAAARYDPQTGEITRFGRQGGPFGIKNVYGYSVGCDGRFIYTAVGKMPWYVVAYDTATGRQKNLRRFDPVDHPEVHQRGKRVFLEVKHGSQAALANRHFRLTDGRMEAVAAIPRFDDSYVPGHGLPQPEIEAIGRNLPVDREGAAIRIRRPGQDWTTIRIAVAGEDLRITRIAAGLDGRLLVATGPYGNVHSFDPTSGSFQRLGNPASKNVYGLLAYGGREYFCGYPNGILGIFAKGTGTLLGDWHETIGSKYAKFLVAGADGRLYSGNYNERESTGGGLGWYDPKTKQFGGIHFPNDDCEWLTTAKGGRWIVYASDFSHDPSHPEIRDRKGQLIVFDTAEAKIVRKFSPLADGSAGVVVETEPGVVLGVGKHEKLPVMYLADLDAAKVLRRVRLPAPVQREIARGPDGQVYLFVGESLVRVNPNTLELKTIGKAHAGRMVFLGNDLYLAGRPQLRRVRIGE